MLIGCLVKIFITSTLVPLKQFNIYGAVIASISAYVISALLNYIYLLIKTSYRPSVFDNIIKPCLSSVVMIIVVLFVYFRMMVCIRINSLSCLISIFAGIIIYVLLLLALGVVSVDFIKEKLVKK